MNTSLKKIWKYEIIFIEAGRAGPPEKQWAALDRFLETTKPPVPEEKRDKTETYPCGKG